MEIKINIILFEFQVFNFWYLKKNHKKLIEDRMNRDIQGANLQNNFVWVITR